MARKKQKEIPGTQRDKIPALEEAIANHREVIEERMGLTKLEVAAKEQVDKLLRKHKKAESGYMYQDGEQLLKVRIQASQEQVKYEKVKGSAAGA